MHDPKKEGVLLIDKEKGRTAFYYVKVLRQKSHIQTIGHAGTLDPFATGVMVLLIGRPYTKLSDRFLKDDKEYLGTIELGVATTTFDCDGEKTKQSSTIPLLEEIEKVISYFQGTIEQLPPMFSAKKVGGQKLYTLARQGIEIERKPVPITLTTTILNYSYPQLTIQVSCSKGTYVRSIANDIGEQLGCFGHLIALKRIRSGSFNIEDCIDGKTLCEPSFCYTPYLRRSV